MQAAQTDTASSCVMTPESITGFVLHEQARGVSENALRRCRRFTGALFAWLPEDKGLTRERLALWREALERNQYTQQTIGNYVKGVNAYLDYMGWPELRFSQGRPRDIRNIPFGYLTPLEPTGERNRRDLLWRCRCRCGNEVELPASRLLSGHTLSCGCMRSENIQLVSKFYAGTHLTMSLKEDALKPDTRSGYTGVSAKRDKWCAHITYRGKRYDLGTYSRLEDAVKARARAKELVMADALQLLEDFEALHRDDHRPDRGALPRVKTPATADAGQKPSFLSASRSDNKSGHPGVCMRRGKWLAYITYQGKKYILGSFAAKEDAVNARKTAEKQLMEDPGSFVACRISG